jgi:beta-glucanase (GH16 family)
MRRKLLSFFGLCLFASGAAAQDRSSAVPAGAELIWADEFDLPGLPDPTKWRYDTVANRTGWYNHELQYYAAGRLQNARVADGHLIITARREALTAASDYGGQHYSSARLITRGRAQWTYGFFEVRAKLPCGAGSWPAIWMLGTGGRWPDDGEIDIMEHVGNDPTVVHATIHNRATAGTSGDGATLKVPTACDAFHLYQLDWSERALRFFVDGVPIHTYAKADARKNGWPFDSPQYLLLNLAVGGDMGGKVDDRVFPQSFEIDYVRVYRTVR